MEYDLIVIGAGIAGLSAAALLANDGYRVLVLEAHIEPGGCASSYQRKRPNGEHYIFDVGATVFAGFRPGGAHYWLGQKLGLTWPIRPLNPAMQVWLPDLRVTRWGDERWIAERQRLCPSQAWEAEQFWREQERLAEVAWRFAGRMPPMPPESLADLGQLATTIRPEMLNLLPALPRTVKHALNRHKVDDRRIRAFIDGQLLISAQSSHAECAWLYGAVALDLARIGTYYVEGGAWNLAKTLEQALLKVGGEIRYRQKVSQIQTDRGQVVGVTTEQGERFRAKQVIANTTVWDLAELIDQPPSWMLRRTIKAVPQGWGAATLYLGIDEAAIPQGLAEHHQIIANYDQALGEANSVFISLHPADDSSRAPAGQRAMTISTHTDVGRWWHWRQTDPARYRVEKIAMAERMLDTVTLAMPAIRHHIRYQQIGTPVSFARYTQRKRGMVGGLPQWRSISGLLSLGPQAARINGLWLVGDSTFPGQSTAAVTQSAIQVYQKIRMKDER
ncbi:FAD-dependent oxidoreductase [Herpetosiphon gulosus]|uniref:4,4'-diapophytoene desaturase (4,4'-diapolycopene-forming) n=1 Tax=Herpetosiphon gulosus TaxID=1973496 RepID=A0ABP9WY06_9CHLR